MQIRHNCCVYVCSHVCVHVCMCSCVYVMYFLVSVAVYTCLWRQALDLRCLSPSLSIFIFFVREPVFHWTQSTVVWLGWLVHKSQAIPALGFQVHATLPRFSRRVLGIWTQDLLFVFQSLYLKPAHVNTLWERQQGTHLFEWTTCGVASLE